MTVNRRLRSAGATLASAWRLSPGRLRTAALLMMLGAVCCWAAYTLGSRPLMARHSPVAVSGLSMVLGTAIYVPMVWREFSGVNWLAVTAWTLFLLVYSALFALCVAYVRWCDRIIGPDAPEPAEVRAEHEVAR